MQNKFFYIVVATSKTADFIKIEAEALNDFSCDGIEEFSLDEETVDELLGTRAYSGGDIPEEVLDEVDDRCIKSYKYYYHNGSAENNANAFKKNIVNKYEFDELEVLEEKWEDWNTKWRENYAPIVVSNELSIIPSWEKTEDKLNEVYIYPGMGFGTGEHETTYLCLKLFETIKNKFKVEDLCLDMGCGSGILGIATIKQSKLSVDFCDIDTNALDNTVQNLELNFSGQDLSDHRLVIRERFILEKEYKLVFANILEHILIDEFETIAMSVNKGGYLIISGILNDQVDSIKETYNGFKVMNVISKGDWSAILFQR